MEEQEKKDETRKVWTREEIIADLKKLKKAGSELSPYQLKVKYGYSLLSDFFPILEHIRVSVPEREIQIFVAETFSRVVDSRDLNFRFGGCDCSTCRD